MINEKIINEKLDKIMYGIEQLAQICLRYEDRFDRIEQRLDRMDERFDRMDAILDRMHERFDRVEKKLDDSITEQRIGTPEWIHASQRLKTGDNQHPITKDKKAGLTPGFL